LLLAALIRGNIGTPLWLGRPPSALLQRQPQLAGVVGADVAAGLQKRQLTLQSLLAFVAAKVSEVPGTNF